MPALLHNYEVLLDFNNDTSKPVSIQLSEDYGRNTNAIVLLLPSEAVSLILQPGLLYRYAVKINSGSVYKVALEVLVHGEIYIATYHTFSLVEAVPDLTIPLYHWMV
ncbi:hypothetical protein C8R41DRAFT_840259 [Lentinula lateritia]|uniref:Uncharacterized protein n=1 Tax=Lentinula lateritia TaxID=40482 RepID=A0ABQ8VA93_9AGAR|nr:hypothetical protein C8R41DRAFT_840259 [Lentinula lateritia]